MLEFSCSSCSEAIKANDDQAGEMILCPKCGGKIKVPGERQPNKSQSDDNWSVFDEDEKFIEESVAKSPDVEYRTRDDDLEPVVDNDEEAAKQEREEEDQAIAESIIRTKSFEFPGGPAVSSDMTLDEKMEQEARFDSLKQELPPDALPPDKPWNRDLRDSPESLKLEGQPSGSLRVKCSVCDSVSIVGEEKAGTTIVCSDCGSDVKVPADSASGKSNSDETNPEKSGSAETSPPQPRELDSEEQKAKREKARIADELFVDLPTEDEGYGLAPPPENILTPTPPPMSEGDDDHDADKEKSPAYPADEPYHPTASKDKTEVVTSALFEEMQEEKSVRFELLDWGQHIFGVITDPGFILRVLTATAIMLIGFSIYHVSKFLTTNELQGVVYLGYFIRLWAFPFIPIAFLLMCWQGQQVLNATITGDKKMAAIEMVSLWVWISNCMFVGIGSAIAAFPGVLLGLLVWTQMADVEGFWAVPAFGAFTQMIFAPILILSALHNRSPFKISSKKIVDSFKEKSDFWIEFYLSALVIAVITSGLWFLGLTEMWFVVLLMVIAVNICYGLYFRMLGRLMGAIVNKVKLTPRRSKAVEAEASESEAPEAADSD